MEIALGKFFLDIIKALRDVFADERRIRDDLVAKGTFLELYGSATRLQGLAQKIRAQKQDTTVEGERSLRSSLQSFFQEIGVFGRILRHANLTAIEVYHPELSNALRRMIVHDQTMASAFQEVAHEYKISKRSLRRVVELYVEGDELPYIPYNRYTVAPFDGDLELIWSDFESISTLLDDFRGTISEVILSNWDFKELATLPRLKK